MMTPTRHNGFRYLMLDQQVHRVILVLQELKVQQVQLVLRVLLGSGATGAQGATGSGGATGAQGDTGATGAQGAAGSASLTNVADNRVMTAVSGSTLNAEANLTYDGTDLVLNGSGDKALRWATGGTNKWSLYHNNGAGALVAYDNANNAERLRITSDGAIAVGSASQMGSNYARISIDCQGRDVLTGVTDITKYGLAFHNDPNTNDANGIGFFNDDGTSCGGYILHQDKGSNNLGDLIFGTSATSNNPIERFRITSTGDVGINKNAPTSVLDVRQTNTGAATEIKLFNLDQSNATTQTAALVMTPDVRANGVKIVAVKEVADMSSTANKDLALSFQTVANNTSSRKTSYNFCW